MPESAAHLFLLHGDDQVAIRQFIRTQKALLGEEEMASLNISTLDGKTVSDSDLRNALLSASFFLPHRLVIINNPLAKLESRRGKKEDEGSPSTSGKKAKSGRAAFLELLEEVPETTVLVLVIEDHQKWHAGRTDWEVCNERHFLVEWAAAHADIARVVGLPLPSEREMPAWLQKKAVELGGKLNREASAELAQFVGNDTCLATLELEKLITYADGRWIEPSDVMTLSTSVISATIWNFTDALGERDARKALSVLHQLMETLDLRQEIFPMVIWLFRQLLLGCELLQSGGNQADLSRELHLAGFQTRKLSTQVRHFTLPQLREAYHRLMAIEEQSKRGNTDLSVLMDQFILEWISP